MLVALGDTSRWDWFGAPSAGPPGWPMVRGLVDGKVGPGCGDLQADDGSVARWRQAGALGVAGAAYRSPRRSFCILFGCLGSQNWTSRRALRPFPPGGGRCCPRLWSGVCWRVGSTPAWWWGQTVTLGAAAHTDRKPMGGPKKPAKSFEHSL